LRPRPFDHLSEWNIPQQLTGGRVKYRQRGVNSRRQETLFGKLRLRKAKVPLEWLLPFNVTSFSIQTVSIRVTRADIDVLAVSA
jgi:hypothetical protein